MRRIFYLLLFIIGLSTSFTAISAQNRPMRGIVWDVPASTQEALQDLRTMHDMKVEAVRTQIVEQDTLFALADSLKIQFFQELPFAHLPTERLLESLPLAKKLLDKALDKGKKHSSARHFGLAQFCNTTDLESASYFNALIRMIRERGAPSTKGYYTTNLLHTDEMAGLVDFTLISTLDAADPLRHVQIWKEYHIANKAGVVLGMGVENDELSGYQVPFSPEAQARYLENNLRKALADNKLWVVFASKWKDGKAWEQEMMLKPPLQYGFQRADNKMRPAFDVVKGFYTGQQQVFAYKAGNQSLVESLWAVLLTWIAFIILIAVYGWSFRLQDMLPRYFVAHKSFQEYLGRTRDALMGTNVMLLTAFALCTGLVIAMFCNLLLHSKGFAYFINWLPDGLENLFVASLNNSWGLVLLMGSLFALYLVVGALILFGIATFFGQSVTPQKMVMLSVWTQWYKPILLVIVLFFYFSDQPPGFSIIIWLIILWGLFALVAFVQRLIDLSFLLKQPAWLVLSIGFGIFFVIGIVVWFLWIPSIQPEWDFMKALFRDEMV